MRSLSPDEQKEAIGRLLADEVVAAAWERHLLDLFGLVHFLKQSGRFTLYAPGNLGKGDFNVYRMFSELALRYARPGGYAAQIMPGGLYGGANASAIRKFLFDSCQLRLLVGCENKGQRFFRGVHQQTWFAVYAAQTGGRTTAFRIAFGIEDPVQVSDAAASAQTLDADFIRDNNPNTYAIPDVRSIADVTVAKKMLDAHPAFGDRTAGPPHRHYQAELHMGNDRERFTTDPWGLPVYEGRMISHFDHRAKTYEGGHGNSSRWIERAHDDPEKAIVPQWRVLSENIPDKLGDRCQRYRLAFGDVANPRNVRSLVAALVPPGVICGDKVPTLDFGWVHEWVYLPWLAVANSFVMDWMARSKLSSAKMSFTLVDSLPFPRPSLIEPWVQRAAPLVLRLVCTAPEMSPFWNEMAVHGFCEQVPKGAVPANALLDESARDLARAQLDALVAREVYALTRVELEDVLETFPVVKKRDLKTHGEYRTKRLVLGAFDALEAGTAYLPTPDLLPADARVALPESPGPDQARPGGAEGVPDHRSPVRDASEARAAVGAPPQLQLPIPPNSPLRMADGPAAALPAGRGSADTKAPSRSPLAPHAGRTPAAVSEPFAPIGTAFDSALTLLRQQPAREFARKDFLVALPDLTAGQWQTLAKQLSGHAEVVAEGARRGRKYRWGGG